MSDMLVNVVFYTIPNYLKELVCIHSWIPTYSIAHEDFVAAFSRFLLAEKTTVTAAAV